jgi:hypothetical protein
MRLSLILLAVIAVSLAVCVVPMEAQDQEDVRGAFLTSRPKEKPQNTSPQTTPTPRTRRRPKATPTQERVSSGTVSSTPGPKEKTQAPVSRARIGIGITLFMRDANGLAVRTDPSRVFRRGDRVRILLETNT